MRATGSNDSGAKDLSILIHRGGLSFFDRQNGVTEQCKASGSVLSPQEACAAIEEYRSMHPAHKSAMIVMADGRNAAVPERLFDEKLVHDYMNLSGIDVSPENDTVTLRRRDEMVFITAIKRALEERLRAIYEDVAITDPLYLSVTCAAGHPSRGALIIADLVDRTMTLTLKSGRRLLFADTVPVDSNEDTVFYIERLLRDNSLSAPAVICAGMAADTTAEMLGHHYKTTILKPEDYFII